MQISRHLYSFFIQLEGSFTDFISILSAIKWILIEKRPEFSFPKFGHGYDYNFWWNRKEGKGKEEIKVEERTGIGIVCYVKTTSTEKKVVISSWEGVWSLWLEVICVPVSEENPHSRWPVFAILIPRWLDIVEC